MGSDAQWTYVVICGQRRWHTQKFQTYTHVGTSRPTDILTEALQQTFASDSSVLTEKCSSLPRSPTTDLPNNTAVVVAPSEVAEAVKNLSVESEEPLASVTSRNSVSYRWMSLSEADISEHQESSLTLSELEAIHGIHSRNVSSTSNRDRNPLNVRILILLTWHVTRNCIAYFLLGGFFFCYSFWIIKFRLLGNYYSCH